MKLIEGYNMQSSSAIYYYTRFHMIIYLQYHYTKHIIIIFAPQIFSSNGVIYVRF